MKKVIAWGVSPIFELYMSHHKARNISYCVDSVPEKQGKAVDGVAVRAPEELFKEDKNSVMVINFGHSSQAIQSINRVLSAEGFTFGENFVDFATFAKNEFLSKAGNVFPRGFDENLFSYARSFNFNSSTPLETTVLGNWLLLEILQMTRTLPGAIAEIGAYKGGNAFLQLSAMSLLNDKRDYFIFDSFQGFDKMSVNDPIELQNAYNYDYEFNLIRNKFSVFPQAKIIKGFVPETFKEVNPDQEFSVVFFDCDLYQPALDTYGFFWDRIKKGGALVIHDNVATKNGWTGVRKATSEYFGPKGVQVHDFWETTMSVVFK